LRQVFWYHAFGAWASYRIPGQRGRASTRRWEIAVAQSSRGALSGRGKPTMEGNDAGVGEGDDVDEVKAFGWRLCELRCWRGLTLREAAGLAGLSFSFWGQVERGEKSVNSRRTLEAMAGALRVHPADLTGQPWAPQDPVGAEGRAGLDALDAVLECYQLG